MERMEAGTMVQRAGRVGSERERSRRTDLKSDDDDHTVHQRPQPLLWKHAQVPRRRCKTPQRDCMAWRHEGDQDRASAGYTRWLSPTPHSGSLRLLSRRSTESSTSAGHMDGRCLHHRRARTGCGF